jgi:DNA-binding transcriptional ArsR family regulator
MINESQQQPPQQDRSPAHQDPQQDHDRQRYAIHAAVFAALSNPKRHELMHVLCKGARTPSELAEALEVSRPNVSQHLALLQREGLVKRTRQGARVLWEVVDPRLSQACELLDQILAPQLAHKARVLEQSPPQTNPAT